MNSRVSPSLGGSQKGGVQKGGFGGCSPYTQNQNEGAKDETVVQKIGTTVPKTGTTVPKTGTPTNLFGLFLPFTSQGENNLASYE